MATFPACYGELVGVEGTDINEHSIEIVSDAEHLEPEIIVDTVVVIDVSAVA